MRTKTLISAKQKLDLNTIHETQDNNFQISASESSGNGNTIHLYNINANGVIIWRKKYSLFNSSLDVYKSFSSKDSSSIYLARVLAGFKHATLVIKISKNGDLIWKKQIPQKETKAIELNNGELLLCSDEGVIVLNSSGEIISNNRAKYKNVNFISYNDKKILFYYQEDEKTFVLKSISNIEDLCNIVKKHE